MPTINMLSSADSVKGQGVGSAYIEQVNLVREGLKGKYDVLVNSKKKCDIQHFHTINPEFFIPVILDKKVSANVGYVHFLPETVEDSLDIPKAIKQLFYKYMIEFYDSMDYLVTVNPYFIEELEKYGIPKNKVTYIPNYVSDDLFYKYDDDSKYILREKWNIPKNNFVVLGVGQVQTRKGIFDFIKCAENMPDVTFVWAGGFSFGQMTDGYKELKEIMDNPPQNVIFTGIVERESMNDIYNIADVMFLPSYSELFPMTILEAMCVKIPILLRDIDIYKNILFDYYLKGNSVEEFIDIINRLKNNNDFYNKWSDNSYKGHEFYSRDNVLHLWEKFYDNVYYETKDRRNNKKFKVKVKRRKGKLYKSKVFIINNTKKTKKFEEWNKIKEKLIIELEKQKYNIDKHISNKEYQDIFYINFIQFFKKNK